MRNKFVLGMVAVSMVAQVALAAPAKAPREVLMEHSLALKESILGKGGIKSLKEVELDTAKARIAKELGGGGELKNAMSGEAGKKRIESLITIIAVKQSLENLSKVDASEAQSMGAAADASVKFIENQTLVGTFQPKTLQGAELSLVRDGMNKIEGMPADIILQFSKAERDSYTQVLKRYNDLAAANKGAMTAEEAFIQAIMDVKKVDRTKALETVKKLKECV